MSLRLQIGLYIGLLHAALFTLLLWRYETFGWSLILLEFVLLASLLIGARLIRLALAPTKAAAALADALNSGELGARHAPVGHREVDAVLESYNRTLADLRREWLRLGEQRGFLERFLSVTPIGVMIFDFENRVSIANRRACELLGMAADHRLAGQALSTVDSPLATTLVQLEVDAPRLTTDAFGRRLLCRRGEFADRGFARSYILIEELTAQLQRNERETYEKLIRMVSHEVTNTVAATNSLLESCLHFGAQLRPEDREDYANALHVLIARNRNLNEFIGRFSELVRLPEPNRQPIAIHELLHAMRTIFRAELEQRCIALEVRADAGLPQVWMDRNQMDRVMMNIIRNAIEAVEQGGNIELAASSDRQFVHICVTDDGPGLSRASKESLFVPFYTTKRQGQGLGLTLVKEILVQHGFTFSLDTLAGKTCFRICMPINTSS
jgi:two-component system, NtrC family, nitrogen regulation sensor histidine kinase NtrY